MNQGILEQTFASGEIQKVLQSCINQYIRENYDKIMLPLKENETQLVEVLIKKSNNSHPDTVELLNAISQKA